MKNQFLKSLLTAALLVFHLSSSAEDIDLFVGATPIASTELPNVLIVIDNTANWSEAFAAEMTALASTVAGLDADKFRLGFMMYTETGSGNANPDGAYVRAAVRTMTATNKMLYQNLITESFDVNDDRTNNGKLGLTMSEVNRYFSGTTAYAGANKLKRDYADNNSGTTASNDVYDLADNALASSSATTYQSPASPGCQKNFVIFLSNGKSNSNSNDNSTATDHLTTAGGSTATISLTPTGFQSEIADEWARYLANKSSSPIVTYVIDVVPTVSGQYSNDYKALLQSMATQGKGKYFNAGSAGSSDVGDKIREALSRIFSEIQSVNSVFAAVSLPVSVNTQGTYLNQVYIGMFRPDANALPRWAGNLKQYKLGFIGNELQLLDAENKSAINNNTNFITECARSFWTPTIDDGYWSDFTNANCVGHSASSNTPDGNLVEKGGQGYKLRSITPSSHTVKTCDSAFASCTSLTDFVVANTAITQALLDPTVGATNRIDLIDWARGLNNNGEEAIVAATVMRPSAHGDVVHSRPVAINFGTDVSPQVVVFYGGNDGVLRAINGNRDSSDGSLNIGSATPGSELWAFVAPEFYGSIKRIRDNTTPVSFKGSASGTPKPYGFDGPISGYQGVIGGAAKTFIYATMRRGGRVLYAFDVTTPASPTLKWKKGCPNAGNDTDCTADFDGIGQTWSSPKTLKSSGYGSGASPMLIMGGGYDACEDADPNTCTSSSKGKHVYVLDANTGVRLKTLDTDRGVVGDVTVVPDSLGLAQYAYAADLGGNVYRISGIDANSPIGSTAPASWTITKIASLGCATPAACSANRKFMFGPSVVADNDGIYRLLLGSGDREKPLTSYTSAYGVANYFFMLNDSPTVSTWLSSENSTCSANVICKDSLFGITTSANPTQAQLDSKPKGWYLGLADHEQVVTSAITLYGVVSFSTHQPAVPVSGSCSSNLGIANSYDIAYTNAAIANGTDQRYELITGGGLSPSPVGGVVTLDNGQTVPFLIKGIKPEEPPVPPGSIPIQPKNRVYWYIQQ